VTDPVSTAPNPAGEEWVPYPEDTSDPSPALPGLEAAEFEHQIITALADLATVARDNPERYRSFWFQETIQSKMVEAVEKLEEALF
jgi:hypothetical protein